MGRYMKRALVGADRADLVCDDPTGQLVTEVEWFDRTSAFELVKAVADAVNRAAERLPKLPGVTVLMPVGQERVGGCPVLLEPSRAFRRNHRIDHHPLGDQVVRADRND